jgi:hypothetical protein
VLRECECGGIIGGGAAQQLWERVAIILWSPAPASALTRTSRGAGSKANLGQTE